MIHQHIFASQKPGMSEADFHDYWINVHAKNFASKIKQIRRYMICTRVGCAGVSEPPVWNGCAEIWLENEEEQLESLQSDEFLNGARLDEPKWAAFWNTLVLDTDANWLREVPCQGEGQGVKLIGLIKRREGMPVDEFREIWSRYYAPLLLDVEGVKGYLQCTARDGWYALGEPRFDALHQIWLDSPEAAEQVFGSNGFCHAQAHLAEISVPRYLYTTVMKEHWIIGPEPR